MINLKHLQRERYSVHGRNVSATKAEKLDGTSGGVGWIPSLFIIRPFPVIDPPPVLPILFPTPRSISS